MVLSSCPSWVQVIKCALQVLYSELSFQEGWNPFWVRMACDDRGLLSVPFSWSARALESHCLPYWGNVCTNGYTPPTGLNSSSLGLFQVRKNVWSKQQKKKNKGKKPKIQLLSKILKRKQKQYIKTRQNYNNNSSGSTHNVLFQIKSGLEPSRNWAGYKRNK